MLETLLPLVTILFIVILIYRACIWYINRQREKGKEKYLNDIYYNKLVLILYVIFASIITIIAFRFIDLFYISPLYVKIILLSAVILIFFAIYILRLKIPQIERGEINGNPKYADQEYTSKMIKKWKLIANILLYSGLILLLVFRIMRWH